MIKPETGIPRIGVGAIIFDPSNRVLLVRRGTPPARGRWSIPGGKQEAGETLIEACLREVLEETGLTITLGPVVAVVERIQEGFHYVIVDFLACTDKKSFVEIIPAGDVIDAQWIDPADISNCNLVEGLTEIISRSRMIRFDGSNGGLRSTPRSQSDYIAHACPAH